MSAKAVLITLFGNQRRVPVADAFEVLHHGQGFLVSRRPFIVEITPKTPEFDEEARHLQGAIVEVAYRGTSEASRRTGAGCSLGQPKQNRPAWKRYARGRRLRVFPPRSVHAREAAEQEFREDKHEWMKRRGFEG